MQMDPDLRDLLSAWLGGEVEPQRLDELLSRLHEEADFRRAFVAEIRMLGMIRTVQSGEPRWLKIEDELGWSAAEQAAGEAFAEKVVRQLGDRPRRRFLRSWGWRWAASLAAAALLIAIGLAVVSWPRGRREVLVETAPDRPFPKIDVAAGLAVVVRLEQVQWEAGEGPHPKEGEILATGRLRLRSGRATLFMLSGVVITVEGPAELDLISIDRVACHRGKLRARVPEEAEGFLVTGPGSAVIDLGTEFGMNIKPDGKSRGKVFAGEVEAAVLNHAGTVRRSQLIKEESNAFEINPGTGRIEPLTGREDFVTPSSLVAPALTLDPSYPDAVLESQPWCYWRFEVLEEGAIPNEVPGRPPLRVNGPIRLAGASRNDRCAVFKADETDQYLEMDGLWEPARDPGYAVEFWFLSETIGHAALASLVAPRGTANHLSLVELTSRNRLTQFRPASVRFLYRWPTGRGGGDNLFTADAYVPYRWHHLVSQVNGARMELFMDGAIQSSLTLDPGSATRPCQFLLGRLTSLTESTLHHTGWRRPFVGRMDEVALYDRPLSVEEIRGHSRLTIKGGAPK